jgi:hypothetical protein
VTGGLGRQVLADPARGGAGARDGDCVLGVLASQLPGELSAAALRARAPGVPSAGVSLADERAWLALEGALSCRITVTDALSLRDVRRPPPAPAAGRNRAGGGTGRRPSGGEAGAVEARVVVLNGHALGVGAAEWAAVLALQRTPRAGDGAVARALLALLADGVACGAVRQLAARVVGDVAPAGDPDSIRALLRLARGALAELEACAAAAGGRDTLLALARGAGGCRSAQGATGAEAAAGLVRAAVSALAGVCSPGGNSEAGWVGDVLALLAAVVGAACGAGLAAVGADGGAAAAASIVCWQLASQHPAQARAALDASVRPALLRAAAGPPCLAPSAPDARAAAAFALERLDDPALPAGAEKRGLLLLGRGAAFAEPRTGSSGGTRTPSRTPSAAGPPPPPAPPLVLSGHAASLTPY